MNTQLYHRKATSYVAPFILFALFVQTGCIVDFDSGDIRNNDYEARATFSEEISVEDHDRIRLDAINGNVTVTGVSGATTITVSGERIVRSDSQVDADVHLQDLEVHVSDLTNEVFVETRQPKNNRGRNYEVNYTITVPQDLLALLDLTNGNIEVDGIHRDVSIDNTNGNVRMRDIVGSARVDLVNGNIDGEVVMPQDGSIKLEVVNGNVMLEIPTSTSAAFEASVTNGSISTPNLSLQEEDRRLRSVKGTLGDGAGDIDLSTVNGNVTARGY